MTELNTREMNTCNLAFNGREVYPRNNYACKQVKMRRFRKAASLIPAFATSHETSELADRARQDSSQKGKSVLRIMPPNLPSSIRPTGRRLLRASPTATWIRSVAERIIKAAPSVGSWQGRHVITVLIRVLDNCSCERYGRSQDDPDFKNQGRQTSAVGQS
jgi:hypothetical protein